ncbi:nicotinamide riboside kinase 1 [Callorhinchus milii]|uniref:Nicotinamide riboside kinase 1 n=1 Tax=Callorhinchus milii TaxID=7868 RepID=V9KYS7_CALMI|nr:nicotinamide riboside kinase 1 [Callorhinchus milii]|eukprot:gi/632962878/ref/XP_007897567.1/ PREDICTED: nicotinamide riboside kinase 1 [Callorhinchus milii]
MKHYIVGIGGMTNGGKSTLAQRLAQALPNSFVLYQDTFFKAENEIEIGEDGFQQYDVISALDMKLMMNVIYSWMKNPTAVPGEQAASIAAEKKYVNILIVDGFLLYNYKPLNDVFNIRYYLSVPYEECKRRRSTRIYTPPDPPGFFDRHVWPMYLKTRKEMEENEQDLIYLDGTNSPDKLFIRVHDDILREIHKLQDGCNGGSNQTTMKQGAGSP